LTREVCALPAAENPGLNASDEQDSTWNGFASPVCTDPNVDVSVVSVASAEQLVGLIRNPCLLISMFTCLRRIGTPLTMVGSTLSAVTRAVVGSMLIVERVTTVPRSNGPAAASIGIDIPNGAPL